MAELGAQKAAGCVAFTDDGRPVASALLMRRALEYAGMLGVPIVNHCEDPSLKGDGVAHEGLIASRLGLPGIPGVAESIMVERDIALAELTGGPYHVCHMSARQSVRAVRAAKERGLTNVTCEVAPHHADEKLVEFDRAPFGIVGLETCVALVFDRLVHAGRIGVARAIELLAPNPARVFRLPGGTLADGAPADITVLAPDAAVTIRAAALRSKSKNTPFDGWSLRGGVAATIVGGRVVYLNEDVNLRI
jgi:dihydroorotase